MSNKKMVWFLALLFIFFSLVVVSASRLPTVGGDEDEWGKVLNDYLSKLAGNNATKLNSTMVNGTNIYSNSINTTHITDQAIRDSDISNTTNLTLGEKITFSLGGVLDNIVNNWIRINSNLNVTGNIKTQNNVTADYFIGNGSQLTGIETDVEDVWVNESGDTMTGDLTMDNSSIKQDNNNGTTWETYVNSEGTLVWEQN